MESTNVMSSSGVTVLGSDAPTGYHLASRTTEEKPNQVTGSAPPLPPVSISPPTDTAAVVGGAVSLKKKRGRPRKHGPDGSVSTTLSPKPLSSSAPPPVIDFSSLQKRGKVRYVGGSATKMQELRMETESLAKLPLVGVLQLGCFQVSNIFPESPSLALGMSGVTVTLSAHFPRGIQPELIFNGEWVSCSVGANFTPHIITVDAGEDITMKVIFFSQQGPRAICILSANGVISSVTLRQPDFSGGTLTYEGRFEILSLTGLFMPSETGGVRNRYGGMSVSLASPDGRVVGGGVAGLLVAANPVQIVVGSFLPVNQVKQKTKKHKPEPVAVIPAAAIPMSSAGMEGPYQTPTLFRGDN